MNPTQFSLVDMISGLLNYIQKKFLLVIAIFALTIAGGVLVHYNSADEYVSKMRIKSNETPFHITQSIIEPVQKAIKIGNLSRLEEWLGIDIEIVRKLKSLEISEVKSTIPYERSEFCVFELELRASEKQSLISFEPAILSYLNDNQYIQLELNARKNEYEQIISESEHQLESLEEIQKVIAEVAKNKSQSNLENLDLGLLYIQKVDIKIIQEGLRTKLNKIKEFKLLFGFSNIEKAKGIIYWIAVGIICGIVINFIIGIIYLWQYLKNTFS